MVENNYFISYAFETSWDFFNFLSISSLMQQFGYNIGSYYNILKVVKLQMLYNFHKVSSF